MIRNNYDHLRGINIGTGKTTLLEILKTYFPNKNNTVIYEPVDEWKLVKDENGVNLLDKF